MKFNISIENFIIDVDDNGLKINHQFSRGTLGVEFIGTVYTDEFKEIAETIGMTKEQVNMAEGLIKWISKIYEIPELDKNIKSNIYIGDKTIDITADRILIAGKDPAEKIEVKF